MDGKKLVIIVTHQHQNIKMWRGHPKKVLPGPSPDCSIAAVAVLKPNVRSRRTHWRYGSSSGLSSSLLLYRLLLSRLGLSSHGSLTFLKLLLLLVWGRRQPILILRRASRLGTCHNVVHRHFERQRKLGTFEEIIEQRRLFDKSFCTT